MKTDLLARINPYIRLAKYDVVETPWIMDERIIYDYEFLYIKEGQLHITIEDEHYDSKVGEIYLFRPGQRHSISVKTNGYVIQPHVHFDLEQFSDREEIPINYRMQNEMSSEEIKHIRYDLIRDFAPEFPSRLIVSDPNYAELLLFDIIQKFKSNNEYRGLALKCAFLRFFEYVLEDSALQEGGIRNEKKLLAEKIGTYLENNAGRRINMHELGDRFHMDCSYLGRVFRENYKISPIRYHQILRLNRCADMLRYTNASVSDVAFMMGFESVNDFSRAFKKQTGVPPSQIRQVRKQKDTHPENNMTEERNINNEALPVTDRK